MTEPDPTYQTGSLPTTINEMAVTIASARAGVSAQFAYRVIADSMKPDAPTPLPGTNQQRILDCYHSAVAMVEQLSSPTEWAKRHGIEFDD